MATSDGNSNPRHAHQLIVCTSCRQGEAKLGPALMHALAGALVDDFTIAGTNCMSGCGRPCTVAFTAPAKMSYLFGDLTIRDVADVIAFAALYWSRDDGIVPWADRPEALRRKILGRIPCLPAPTGDGVEP